MAPVPQVYFNGGWAIACTEGGRELMTKGPEVARKVLGEPLWDDRTQDVSFVAHLALQRKAFRAWYAQPLCLLLLFAGRRPLKRDSAAAVLCTQVFNGIDCIVSSSRRVHVSDQDEDGTREALNEARAAGSEDVATVSDRALDLVMSSRKERCAAPPTGGAPHTLDSAESSESSEPAVGCISEADDSLMNALVALQKAQGVTLRDMKDALEKCANARRHACVPLCPTTALKHSTPFAQCLG